MELGRSFARTLIPGDVVAVFGDLGSGKTRFIKGICAGLGVKEHVASPTFTIVTEYSSKWGSIFHFDFYRIESLNEIFGIGFDEYLTRGGICLIEWAEKALPLLPDDRFDVRLELGRAENDRIVSIQRTKEVVA
jgi:tRNA threonylcarbamoyladenosine biosynthesis protein TsaE